MNDQTTKNDMEQAGNDAGKLVKTAANAVGGQTGRLGEQLAPVIEKGAKFAGLLSDKLAESAKTADASIRKNPYPAIAVGVGVGILLGFLVARRNGRD